MTGPVGIINPGPAREIHRTPSDPFAGGAEAEAEPACGSAINAGAERPVSAKPYHGVINRGPGQAASACPARCKMLATLAGRQARAGQEAGEDAS